MYEEERKFNWLGLFLKVIIVVVFVLLAIWLVSSVVKKVSNSSFEKNLNIMKSESIEYFKKGNLPEEVGDVKKVTLGDLIKMKYIDSFDKKCDRTKSYSQATLVDDYYSLRVELVCGSKKDSIYTAIDKQGKCIGDTCDKKDKDKDRKKDSSNKKDNNKKDNNKKDNNNDSNDASKSNTSTSSSSKSNDVASNNNNNNSSSNTNGSSNSNTSGKTPYYEYVKVNKEYSNWQVPKIKGSNVEEQTQVAKVNTYCQVVPLEYYLVFYPNKNYEVGKTYVVNVRLDNIPISTNNFKLVKSNIFNDNNSYNKYLDNKLKVSYSQYNDAKGLTTSLNTIKNSSLTTSNITISNTAFGMLNDGIHFNAFITINNLNNVSSYQGKYFIPLYIKLEYEDYASCIEDLASNSSNYSDYNIKSSSTKTVNVYRSYSLKKDESNKTWSSSDSLDGYIKTGNTTWK